ncbi:sensor histidine kinase [Nonomuraea sp. NPDC049480]|uniref:sensor histidine kinase n=1 Tax=Nonomuraea sp. NPDC049480 TaxID=3364353 RepID=UPI0037A71992
MSAPPSVRPSSTSWPFRHPRTWWIFALLFTAVLWLDLVKALSVGEIGHALLIAVYVACYVAGIGLTIDRPLVWRLALCALAAAVSAPLVLVYGQHVWNLSYALAIVGFMLPWTAAFGLAAAAIVLMIVTGVLSASDGRSTTMIFLLVVLSSVALAALWRSNRALVDANATIAELAVLRDRERMSRDLHDVIGSTLTTITVKAGLARRLLESHADEPVHAEVTDIEVLGRQALADVRAAVTATHHLSMDTALADAAAVLHAAGIQASLPTGADQVADRYRSVFAYVVREGVTNVVKHSRARHCQVRLGPTFIDITDDGDGTGTGGGAGTSDGGGHGLAGLARRLRDIGGTLEAGALPGGGYRLRAECPR